MNSTSAIAAPAAPREIFVGARGGQYYLTAQGKKAYLNKAPRAPRAPREPKEPKEKLIRAKKPPAIRKPKQMLLLSPESGDEGVEGEEEEEPEDN